MNAQRLESGLSAKYSWTHDGGTIGSSLNADWILTDAQDEINSEHCYINVIDGAYCLKNNSASTYINGSNSSLKLGETVKLAHKDEVIIGPYHLRVLFGDLKEIKEQYDALDGLFSSHESDLLNTPIVEGNLVLSSIATEVEPLKALDSLIYREGPTDNCLIDTFIDKNEDPEQALVTDDNLVLQDVDFTLQTDSEYEISSSIRLKKILMGGFIKSLFIEKSNTKEHILSSSQLYQSSQSENYISKGIIMDEKVLDLLDEEVAKSINQQTITQVEPSRNATHLVTGPILDGLGVNLSDGGDMSRMHLLSQEVGESLQSCIRGLLELHQQVDGSRFGTLNRNLQPIEDNPLRLGLSYEETIHTLYDADKSLVHLSAPAAIAESLKAIHAHNASMQYATSDALSQILNAFSPEVMLRRFHHYKRSSDTTHSSTEEWAWNMYCNYYQELISNRQSGFEKLFWEIFEQSYDRKIREKQREL
jgi:type VI secretion system protein ImpI